MEFTKSENGKRGFIKSRNVIKENLKRKYLSSYILYWGACGITVIAVGNGLSDPSLNPVRGCLYSIIL